MYSKTDLCKIIRIYLYSRVKILSEQDTACLIYDVNLLYFCSGLLSYSKPSNKITYFAKKNYENIQIIFFVRLSDSCDHVTLKWLLSKCCIWNKTETNQTVGLQCTSVYCSLPCPGLHRQLQKYISCSRSKNLRQITTGIFFIFTVIWLQIAKRSPTAYF